MAIIKPFAALLPKPELANQICELPYDVLSTAEARALAADNPWSFFHVSKPEIDLPVDIDPHDPAVYAQGRENFAHLLRRGALIPHPKPAFYLYRQILDSHQQLGLVALASCAEYEQGSIKKHEFTRPDKEDDRVRHMQALQAQTGPAFLTYAAPHALDQWCAKLVQQPPHVDFVAEDRVRHTSWIVDRPEDIETISTWMAQVPCLYIADGHHRSAAAVRLARAQKQPEDKAFFLSVLFPDTQVQILPYNRVIRDLNGQTPAQVLEKLESLFRITPAATATPVQPHQVHLFLEGQWRSLVFRPERVAGRDPQDRLDVSLLQRLVLNPVFNIEDPRTSQRIAFVGGSRGTAELEKLVRSGAYACAFCLFPTRIEDLMAISDQGGIMPPKSTWFEPKLRDGMFCHRL